MCGLTGLLDIKRSLTTDQSVELTKKMTDTLSHRGPDDSGIWSDAAAGITLGHRRLAIIDLSKTGSQPMTSQNGRYIIVYNGEVYNATDLSMEMQKIGISFRGHSDTEVILEGISTWGLEKLIERLIGMFAFAVWDRQEQTLHLVRDRLGIKPLYWGQIGNKFVFASELKAIRNLPNTNLVINRDALVSLLRHNYILGPLSIYKGIEKVPAGSIISIGKTKTPNVTRYWNVVSLAEKTQRNLMPEAEAREKLKDLLGDSVKRRMISDVPLGAFLSGGIDSSLVVALMQSYSSKPIKTFTVGFHNRKYNEAHYAKEVANHLGTDHTEVFLDEAAALDLVPKLPIWFDEPFADVSQIPTYLVSKIARKRVTVALSGDGGDEVFAGYTRYLLGQSFANTISKIPKGLRQFSLHIIQSIPQDSWSQIFGLLPAKLRPPQAGERLHKLAIALKHDDPDRIYRSLISQWQKPTEGVIEGIEANSILWNKDLVGRIPDTVSRMQILDLLTYLPDDILTKVDRASMAVSLEARVPFLDHRLVEMSWRMPNSLKIKNSKGKWLLREMLSQYLPIELINRPKQGFTVPVGAWLRGPLREWAEELLSEKRINQEDFFNPAPIRAFWQEHKEGKVNRQHQLWGPLMFQAWLENNKI